MKFISGNGWSFDSDEMCAPDCNRYAQGLGLKDVTVWMATAPNGTSKEYAIFEGQEPVYSNTSLEAVGAHLDIMALQRFGTHPSSIGVLTSTKDEAKTIIKRFEKEEASESNNDGG